MSTNSNKATIPVSNIFGELMSVETLKQLRSRALKPPEPERAELAHALGTNLNASADANAVEEWDKEILRCPPEVDSGVARYIDRNEFQQRMQVRVGN